MSEEKELTYGEAIKQPFPKLEDVDKFNVPQWIRLIITDAKPSHLSSKWEYKAYKLAYENGVDVTWQLKQTDPHHDIKAGYEKAKEKYDVVKLFWKMPNEGFNTFVKVPSSETFNGNQDTVYTFECYNIDWNKLLSGSYANSEFVEVMPDDNSDFRLDYKSELRGIEGEGEFLNEYGDSYKYCRLAKGVEIKDEWLTEVKQCQPSQ